MRYFTLVAFNTNKRSSKSGNMDAFLGVSLGRQFSGGGQSHMGGLALPIGILVGLDLIEIGVATDAIGRAPPLRSGSKLSVMVVYWFAHFSRPSWTGVLAHQLACPKDKVFRPKYATAGDR